MMGRPGRGLGADDQNAEESGVYVVRAHVTERSTGATRSTSIIGMFDSRTEADKLVDAFNTRAVEQERKSSDEAVRAYLVRYGMPYAAPAVKKLMEE